MPLRRTPRPGKTDPYVAFKDDKERRIALNFANGCLTFRYGILCVSLLLISLIRPELLSKLWRLLTLLS